MPVIYRYIVLTIFISICCTTVSYQQPPSRIDSFIMYGDVKITIDHPVNLVPEKETIISFFALPNGNSTEQTMGRKIQAGDDWHFNIQHIRAQTAFIRQSLKKKNFIVIYLENNFRSWPLWKQKHLYPNKVIQNLFDSLSDKLIPGPKSIYLNGHSGGGSFIFGYLASVEYIPEKIKRISFIDSDYGYDSSYYPKLKNWLKDVRGTALNVFAYNDSIALYNGKPLVSATGGTWHRSHLLLKDLQKDFYFSKSTTDSLHIFKSHNNRMQFFFKINTDGGIYHTQQVELNGFIHSTLCGTRLDSKKYRYYSNRAYTDLIK